MTTETSPTRVRRVRHETRRRTLVVKRRQWVSRCLLRLTFTSDDLADFTSLGFDDHIKLFFTDTDGTAQMRDYTPRRHDPARRELDIEFAIHPGGGPATSWALSAKVGSALDVGGPRGSFVIDDSFAWYMFIGDATALPAIGRRLGELRADVPAHVVVAVDDQSEIVPLPSAAAVTLHWVVRGQSPSLEAVVRGIGRPSGEGYVWVAAEASEAKSLRRLLVEDLGQPASAIRAAAYWRRGEAAVHQLLDGTDGPQPAA